MEPKDIAYTVGIVLTFLIGLGNLVYTYRTTRLANFINTVTNQRVKWIEQLRQDISSFAGNTHTWCYSKLAGKPREYEVLKEIDRLRHVIRLRLNPGGTLDQRIESLIHKIPQLTDSSQLEYLQEALEDLTTTSQKLLKEEWEKVKREAQHGNLKKPTKQD